MHHSVSTDNGIKKLPNTILHYSTKYSMDVMDQMAQLYLKGRQPPLAGSCILPLYLKPVATINAHVLYKECMNVTISRHTCILELVKELCEQHKMAVEARKRFLPETFADFPVCEKECVKSAACSGNQTYELCQTCSDLFVENAERMHHRCVWNVDDSII